MHLLGVDIGTSGTKTVLFDEAGHTVASATYEYPLYQPHIGWAEQEPEDWWQATRDSIKQVVQQAAAKGITASDIKGIGLSGQMHGMVLLDKDHHVLRPAIIWCDQRTQAECDQITATIGAQRLIEITANPALTGFTASKVMWVKNNQPDIFDKITKVLLPKDYIRFKLTGTFASEVSDASGMQFLDVPNRCWSREVLDKLGIPFDWMADVHESQEITSQVSASVASETGLVIGTPIVGGGGDQAAGALGNGIVKAGVISCTLGTSGVVFAHSDDVSIDPKGRVHTFCHAVPGKWHIMAVTQGAGLSLQWLRNQFGGMERDLAAYLGIDPYILMSQEAEQADAGCGGLVYLPYLMGERTPHLDPNAKGVFFGLSAKHTRNDMIRSVMEGVAYSQLDGLNIIRGMGVACKEVRASGGGARSPFWRQMMADMFETDVVTVNSSEGGALGVALLAGVACGAYDSIAQACDAVIGTLTTQLPGDNKAVYKRFYPVYQALYPALKPTFDQVASLI